MALPGLSNEMVGNILFQASTPTFIQLTQTTKDFAEVARQDRKLLFHHLRQIAGDKAVFEDAFRDNDSLYLLLRQRAANNLYGSNFSANMTEYLARSALVDPLASSISGLDADYVRHALVFKDTTDIRQYTNQCSLKERIKQPPGIKVLRLIQWSRYISVLCCWSQDKDGDLLGDVEDEDSDNSDSDSETEILLKNPLPPTTYVRLLSPQPWNTASSPNETRRKLSRSRRRRSPEMPKLYRICHYDIYTLEESQTFEIDSYLLNFVPRDFIVHNTVQCAVLWDADNSSGRPTKEAVIVQYTASQAQTLYPAKYDAKVRKLVVSNKPPAVDSDDDEEDEEDRPMLPERIAYFKDGRRIKVYAPGGVVPYMIFTTAGDDDRFAPTNKINFDGMEHPFYVDNPFYGTHARYYIDEAQHDFCFQTHLCLGLTRVDISDEDDDDECLVKILCILRSQSRLYPDSCDHNVSLQRMTHVSARNSTVVARLWGWEELDTNLTGKEIVSISSGGTRIAIALWNKVLVYPLNPRILCEEVSVDSSDDESTKSKKKRKKADKPWQAVTSGYYKREKERLLNDWKIAELRPIVLDLDGAVAHKMHWSAPKGMITDTQDPVLASGAAAVQAAGSPIQNEYAISEGSDDSLSSDDTVEPTVETMSENTATPAAQHNASPSEPIETQLQEQQPETIQTDVNEQTSIQDTTNEPPIDPPFSPVATQLTESPENANATNEAAIPVTQQTMEPPAPLPTPSPSPSPVLLANVPTSPPVSTISSSLPIAKLGVLSSSLFATSPPASIATISKPSPRKLEKAVEVGSIPETPLEKHEKHEKAQSGYPSSNLKHKTSIELAAPSSPLLSKNMPKPKVTALEPISAISSPDLPPAGPSTTNLEPQIAAESACIPGAASEPLGADKESLCALPASHEGDCDAAIAIPNTLVEEAANALKEDESIQEVLQEPARRHKRRITEDELTILTDRGVQIWNLGAKSKGVRLKRTLCLEESLAGILPPLLKQKGVIRPVAEED